MDYEKNGAQAISVLTDVDFFQGSLLYLLQARESVSLPILRKEFIIDPLQIEEAHICGADAILLMASILDAYQLKDYMAQAEEYSIDCLVEVHDEEELDTVLGTKANLIGINNRNLKDFKWRYFLLHIPLVFKKQSAREHVTKKLSKLLK